MCEVKDISNSDFGVYKVESQGALMTVYSERKDFAVGDFVHVLVPLGDYTQKKTIVDKVIEASDVVIGARPFETFAPVINNINRYYGTSLDEHLFIVNKDYEKILYQQTFDEPKQFLGYNRMGIRLSIYSNLKTMTQEVMSGRYRIFITLTGIDLEKENSLNYAKVPDKKEFVFDMEDMVFINPYFTSGYCNQEKVFDIQNFAITSIKIYVKQTEDFLDQNKENVNSESFFIKFKNLRCAFGFYCTNADIDKEKLYIYPVDGLCYNSGQTDKKVDAKLIEFKRDEKLMPYAMVSNPIGLKAWGRYSPDSSMMDDNFKILGYTSLAPSSLDRGEDGYFTLSLNINKGLQQNKFILSMSKSYEGKNDILVLSNELIFKNNDFIKNADLLDNILGFTGKLSDERESFNVYGLDNKLLNDFDENHIFYLIVSYNSVNGRQIEPGDEISWTFPAENTMLVPYPNIGKNSFIITVPETFDDNYPEEKFYRIPFKIKNVYNQNYINNTINCSLSFTDSNGYVQHLSFSKTILFGFSGSEGSRYIYNLELYKQDKQKKENIKVQCISNKQENFDDYTLKLNIFDYNMKLLDFDEDAYTITYKWIKDKEFQTKENFDLTKFNKISNKMDRIIVAKCDYGLDESSLTYLPIGTIYESSLSDNNYLLEGCKTIVYDMLGVKPYYYKGAYKLYRNEALITKGINFSVNASNLSDDLLKPVIMTGSNRIQPYGTYVDGFTNFSILIQENGEQILEFPVVVMRSQYTAMTEYLEKAISVLKEEKVRNILLGQLSFNQETQKTEGMIIGKNDTDESSIGLYSYINGKNFFTLDNSIGLLVGDPDANDPEEINLWNGNLHNFNLINCSGSIGNASIANSAKKLIDDESKGISLGSNTKPIYFNNGVPVICSEMATTTQLQQLSQQISSMQQTIERLQRQIDDLSK